MVGDREVHPPLRLGLDLVQLGSHLLLARDPPQLEPPGLGLRADVREAEELERLRLPKPARRSSLGGEPSELDQPRLVRMQLQPELREPVAQISQEPLGVLTMLKARQEVVGVPRPARVSLAVFPSGRLLPSTTSAPAETGLFGSFAGTTSLSDFPRSCIRGLPPQRSPHGPTSAGLPPREP